MNFSLNQLGVVTFLQIILLSHLNCIVNSAQYSYILGNYGYHFKLDGEGRRIPLEQPLSSSPQTRYLSMYQLYHPRPSKTPQLHYASLDRSELGGNLASPPIESGTSSRDKYMAIFYQNQRHPKRMCKEEGVQAHPTECNKFIRCQYHSDESLFYYEERNCPEGLAFDRQLETCNYVEQVPNCGTSKHRAAARPSPTTQCMSNTINTPPQYISPQSLPPSPSKSLLSYSSSLPPTNNEGRHIGTKSLGKPIYTRHYPKISSKPSTRKEEPDQSNPQIYQMDLPKFYTNDNSDEDMSENAHNTWDSLRLSSVKNKTSLSSVTKFITGLDKHKRTNKTSSMADSEMAKNSGRNPQKRRKTTAGQPNNKLEDLFIEPAASSINMQIIQTTRAPSFKTNVDEIKLESNSINSAETRLSFEELEAKNDY